ncbi:MAG TPA: class I SAM-dependent methyltransferase, partial [Candidatus Omnitrophota bacterium]|nr:class I SAM-dependent methyltransferase [Candidatus Omnitrophota bacterium]
ATNLAWAKDNLELNGFSGPQHTFVQSDVGKFLLKAFRDVQRFSLAFVDPPSFFQDKLKARSFDVNRDHPQLIRDVLRVMSKGATVFFSTNHQRFAPKMEGLPVQTITELTPKTIPEDFRNQAIHRCWRMTV